MAGNTRRTFSSREAVSTPPYFSSVICSVVNECGCSQKDKRGAE